MVTTDWKEEALGFFVGETNLERELEEVNLKHVLKQASTELRYAKTCVFSSDHPLQCNFLKRKANEEDQSEGNSLYIGYNPSMEGLKDCVLQTSEADIVLLAYSTQFPEFDRKEQLSFMHANSSFVPVVKAQCESAFGRLLVNSEDFIKHLPYLVQLGFFPIAKLGLRVDHIVSKVFPKSCNMQYFAFVNIAYSFA